MKVMLVELDDCVAGVVSQCGRRDVLCYDVQKILNVLMERDGMTLDDAREYFDFNIIGSYLGEFSPCFINLSKGVDTDRVDG